jgi:hypothetical protein
MPRLPPTPATIKKLFALSGNCCAFTGCRENIVDSDGNLIGEVCHIEAAEPKGERYNQKSNDEYRRSFPNLILLCGKHHKITNDIEKYDPLRLKEIKAAHETKFLNKEYHVSDDIIKQAISVYMDQANKNQGSGSQINNQADTQNIGTQIGSQHIYNMNATGEPEDDKSSDSIRPINKTLKNRIEKLILEASPPTEDVIDFKNDLIIKRASQIYELPVKELKYRKENGRIKAEVESHEQQFGVLDEKSDETQKLLREFLEKNDPEKKEILKQQIKHKGQLKPAIITCDGFLINGNRRKMIFEELYEQNHQNSEYENMRVIILPENVSVFDIKRIENRYQMQDEGKSEYHGLNRALTLRDNIKDGYSLEAQILDDPQYADKTGKDLQAVVNDFKKRYLKPLECVDKYLKTFNRENLYNTISERSGDKEGRWQAFTDYSTFYNGTLENKSKLAEYKVKESEVGKIENAIFKIIRKRNLNSKDPGNTIGKLHEFVRKIPKYIKNPDAKEFLIKIADEVKEDIPEEMKYDKMGKKYDEREIDDHWGNHYKRQIVGNLIQAHKVIVNQEERDKPLELLEDALKKLKHDNLKIENMDTSYYERAMNLSKEISAEADVIYGAIDHARYNLKKLNKRK